MAHSADFPAIDKNQPLNIYYQNENLASAAEQIAKQFQLNFSPANNSQSLQQAKPLWYLLLADNGLQLHFRDNDSKPLTIDFNSKKNNSHKNSMSKKRIQWVKYRTDVKSIITSCRKQICHCRSFSRQLKMLKYFH